MKICIVTDAWRPQVNGVVVTLSNLIAAGEKLGHEFVVIGPDQFHTIAAPSYPEIRLALTSPKAVGELIRAHRPDHIHIATEGPLGVAASYWCPRNGELFTTSYHTRFPEYVEARWPIPAAWSYAALRRFHSGSAGLMVATQTLADDLSARGFQRPMLWPRGVDQTLFRPVEDLPTELKSLPRPFFLYCGRVAPEKNIEAFLTLDLPGSKIVVGDGPSRLPLQERFPKALFVGVKARHNLAPYYSAADVFVFPSRTDTFGNVMIEALACGAPVAAFPVPGPIDVITDPRVGLLSEDLRAACLGALQLSRADCRAHAARYTWPESARIFIDNIFRARAAALTRRASA
ncbi:glycosyltransferase family 1 protein [Rhodoblastus acidophilus]|uniref:Glycosyltransferase family 1 protein n=1 Tax=Candidatus Rhodoblastus alkanivorans TaxID=2954117 RepID=A0ABS9ZAH3_9HYPH|nr:glycosyltransferase family 1 protein [Candidatus Rhodoblastus alkanivorans]MCI4677198.1 glycosyltransferase family 1 protein [Candidatus Rhodoblastus alkanivorans]MCI4684551.1 glycosyltransferase family 1 protein [Candidatus Rhodoblastus alkanivorans]MDI4641872.1 glycosyltransferase family 1 protein [Rhodoblastus acidophilus]